MSARTFISRGFCQTLVRMLTMTALECIRWVTHWLGRKPVSQVFAFRMDEKPYIDGRLYIIIEFFSLLTVAGAEVAVLCITKSGEVVNYQAFTNSKGVYKVAETMPESDRWDACLARPISSFHEHCTQLGGGTAGVKFSYNHPSGYFHTVRPFVYRTVNVPTYC
ncbi:hypothetical protein EUGRSUZ_F03456 [Eucalyptus grandis]|uniref:Uncharacterized protein n=2 Tax=Eucalyptus grandis TaxID=71139 RepID=A0ACC3KLM5_EUCGR|nr:hypothetical protein EUGRSUZ_F03456 [Eucalyptus grandis]